MPLPLAILYGILLTILIFRWAGFILLLSMLLFPIYYAIKNVRTELPKDGNWKVCWDRFFQVICVELNVVIMFVVNIAQSDKIDQYFFISVWMMAYLLYLIFTTLCISFSKGNQ